MCHGYTQAGLEAQIAARVDFETFFAEAPAMHSNTGLITGVVCGVQVEALQMLVEMPEKWFSGREHSAEWPNELDGHSAYHRTKDIERALRGG